MGRLPSCSVCKPPCWALPPFSAKPPALCPRMETSCAELKDAKQLVWSYRGFTAADCEVLGMVVQCSGLPQLQTLFLDGNRFDALQSPRALL